MSGRKRRDSSDSAEEIVDSEEEERRKDLKERDEFSKRLKAKDESKTRKIVESVGSKKSLEEAAKRMKLISDDGSKDKLVSKLRIQSRREYLSKRKEDKVAELEADILDDEYLFDETQLTEKEKKDREYKKNVLNIAKQHDRARELERIQRYHMPKDIKKGEKSEYVEVDEFEKMPNSEQKKWEAEQLQSALYKFGSKDAKTNREYELLLEDEIEFVQVLTMGGDKDKDKPAPVTEETKKKMDIQETKKSLPVYPFRDDLIAAIREHQVLIIEGETGN
jgi:pre-mRNA-splicing factor ATP-dependent RNA helicase DHX16